MVYSNRRGREITTNLDNTSTFTRRKLIKDFLPNGFYHDTNHGIQRHRNIGKT
jgi:hypothetical protein